MLEPTADGFRNYLAPGQARTAEELLVDRASLLDLTAPEMTVLVGGLRVLGANTGGSDLGVLTERQGSLTNDFFVNICDMETVWEPDAEEATFTGRDRVSGAATWTAAGWTCCSAPTRDCGRCPRCTPVTTRRTNSCRTSSRPG